MLSLGEIGLKYIYKTLHVIAFVTNRLPLLPVVCAEYTDFSLNQQLAKRCLAVSYFVFFIKL